MRFVSCDCICMLMCNIEIVIFELCMIAHCDEVMCG